MTEPLLHREPCLPILAQYNHNPLGMSKGILRYVKGMLNYGLKFIKSSSLILNGFLDADRAECPNDRKFTSDFAVFLGSNLIS
jgi:hypothetical protein